MSKTPKLDPKKALKFEAKGDKLVKKGKFRDALKEYQKSKELNPDRIELYEKLIETLNRFEHDWGEEDFSNSMTWTMRRQELENPQLKLVHQTFSIEYKEVQKLVQRIMLAPDEKIENQLIEQILGYGEKASLPLLHFLLSMKALATQNPQGAEGNDDFPPNTL